MPPKKEKKPRARRAPAKKNKGLKQKQKQRQVVNVQVSSGGSGGGGGFIPIPQAAPAIDYRLISQLIRPANTVDVPIREAAPMAAPLRPAMAEPRPDLPVSRRPFAGETEEEYGDRMAAVEARLVAKSEREKKQREMARISGLPEAAVAFVDESGGEGAVPTTVRRARTKKVVAGEKE
jgi:hypothetical protein